jgi:hypothetical protein
LTTASTAPAAVIIQESPSSTALNYKSPSLGLH